jgi:hypoxanthine phosphoribosyltransferase
MALQKTYIDANQLLLDSYELALQVLDSEFRPDLIVGVWRGGTPVAIAIHELLHFLGVSADHIAIRTSHYTGINQTADGVSVEGLEHLLRRLNNCSHVLLVDDVFDTGRSLQQVITEVHQYCGDSAPAVKIATPYFKPSNNTTSIRPDYYLHQTDAWLVFPHELDGLSNAEIAGEKPGLGHLRERVLRYREGL